MVVGTPTPAQAYENFGPYKAKVDIDGRRSLNPADVNQVDAYKTGENIFITCQASGTTVGGSPIWDYTVHGYWIPDVYVSTGVSGYLAGVPRCSQIGIHGDTGGGISGKGPFPAKVDINGRRTPNPGDVNQIDAYKAGELVHLRCQDTGAPVNGNSVWGYTTDGYWIPDTYITTGVNGFLSGIPKCGAIGVSGGAGASGDGYGPYTAKVDIDGRGSRDPNNRIKTNAYKAGRVSTSSARTPVRPWQAVPSGTTPPTACGSPTPT